MSDTLGLCYVAIVVHVRLHIGQSAVDVQRERVDSQLSPGPIRATLPRRHWPAGSGSPYLRPAPRRG